MVYQNAINGLLQSYLTG